MILKETELRIAKASQIHLNRSGKSSRAFVMLPDIYAFHLRPTLYQKPDGLYELQGCRYVLFLFDVPLYRLTETQFYASGIEMTETATASVH